MGKIGELFPCEICGKLIVCKNPNQKYCSDCSYEVSLRRKRNGVGIGEEFACESCGKIIVRKSGAHIYCDDCARNRKITQSKESAERNGYKKEEPKQIGKPQFTIAEVNQAARDSNMTYGKYVAMLEMGLVDPPKKLPEKKCKR